MVRYPAGEEGSLVRFGYFDSKETVEGVDPILRVNFGPSGGCPAVGGVIESVNTLSVLAPWMAVIGLVGCIGIIVVAAKKR